VLERDLTAIRGEGKYRGPIQVQSNALAALEALDPDVADAVLAEGVMTGDRVNGLCDGLTGDWYVKFDMFHLAADAGLPVTRVISRFTLQRLLADACVRLGGEGVLVNEANVVAFEETGPSPSAPSSSVWAVLDDGTRFEGDALVGADGIWSKVRRALFGDADATYADYTCYTGIADFTPPDIDVVGYRVFLGTGKYFVSSDVGDGKMQWYGFNKEPAGGDDPPGGRKERLLSIFDGWTDQVTDLVRATPEADVLRRDIYDRPPILSWARGRVALLGDSAHAMQPNLGQGGCMAIEDGYTLAVDLADAVAESRRDGGRPLDVPAVLRRYERARIPRAAAIHGLARMAAIMASTYKAYLGDGLGPLAALSKLRIPHPGRVGGYVAMNAAMPSMLGWVLGGNVDALKTGDRADACRLGDVPSGFREADFPRFLADDGALAAAARCAWFVVPEAAATAAADAASAALDAAAPGTQAAVDAALPGLPACASSRVLEWDGGGEAEEGATPPAPRSPSASSTSTGTPSQRSWARRARWRACGARCGRCWGRWG
jgi:zeaxanthin epoxidase